MADIFNKNITPRKGPLARAETMGVFINSGLVGLAQNVSINYGQQIQPVYELGTFDAWMVSGRTQGQVSMARVIGNSTSDNTGQTPFDRTLRSILGSEFWEVDGGAGGVLTLKDSETGVEYKCSGCYINNAGVGADANGSVVVENISMMIQLLQIEPGNPGTGAGVTGP